MYGGQDGGYGGGLAAVDEGGFGIMDSLHFKEKVDAIKREGWVEGRDHILTTDSDGVWHSFDAPLMSLLTSVVGRRRKQRIVGPRRLERSH